MTQPTVGIGHVRTWLAAKAKEAHDRSREEGISFAQYHGLAGECAAYSDAVRYIDSVSEEIKNSTEFWEKAKCEVCGEPAVTQVFDMLQYVEMPSGITKAKHYGGPHLFCKEHTRESYWRKMGPIYPPPT